MECRLRPELNPSRTGVGEKVSKSINVVYLEQSLTTNLDKNWAIHGATTAAVILALPHVQPMWSLHTKMVTTILSVASTK